MRWHQSLYWRIATGFVGYLGLLLIVQAVLFVWVVAQPGRALPNQPPARFAQTIALDVSEALGRDAGIDLDQFIRQEYAEDAQPFLVLLVSGRTIEIGGPFPPAVVRESRDRLNAMVGAAPEVLERGRGRAPGGPFGAGGGSGRGGPLVPGGRGALRNPDQPFARGGPAGSRSLSQEFRMARPGLIVVGGELAGFVVVPQELPFRFLLARYAPILGAVAGGTLIVGALLAAVIVFGPARRRLRAVEDAARRLGGGDLTARAPVTGADEVSAVAAAFNAMATDLSARAEALAASDRARRQLLADVSHELTTPVTAMRGYIETLSMPELALDTGTRARYLGIIGDETSRLEHIIGDLLDLARLEGGGGSLAREVVSTESLFDRVKARHEGVAAGAGVTLATHVAPGAARVTGDRERLERALQNLTANALRHAPDGSSIVLSARPVDGGMAFTVEDSGPGIAPEHLPRVFDRFYKVDESRAARPGPGSAGGSGLGLSIVKAIVERHGGTITVESRPGRTCFEFTIRQ